MTVFLYQTGYDLSIIDFKFSKGCLIYQEISRKYIDTMDILSNILK